jgi:hypothetical protein
MINDLGRIGDGALLHPQGKKVLRIYRSCLAGRSHPQTMRFLTLKEALIMSDEVASDVFGETTVSAKTKVEF